MFQFSVSEMLLLAVVAIVFIGPKELPKLIKSIRDIRQQLFQWREQLTSQMDLLTENKDITNPDPQENPRQDK